MQKTGRSDTVSQATPAGAEYVPMEDAAKALFGGKVRGGAEAARQRMLGRRGLSGAKSEPASDRRQAMIDRKQK